MASRSFHDLFLRARDQFVGSGRWTYLAALVLAVLHLAIVMPFAESSRIESEITSERSRLAAVERSTSELSGALEAIRAETSSTFTPVLQRLVEDLEHDLARLATTRRQYVREDDDRGAAEDVEEPATDKTRDVLLEEGAGPTGATPFMIDNPDWIADLRDAETRDEELAALAPLAEDLIARPRYFDLERSWKGEALPRLEGRLDAAAGAVPRLRGRFPEARAEWESLAGAFANLSRSAGELRLEPPAAPFWWALPAAGDEIELGLTANLADEIRRPRPLTELETAAERILERYAAVEARILQAKTELGDPTAGNLGGMVAGFAATFPLLVGLLLGGGVIWRSQRLRELGLTTRLAIEHGGPADLRQWLWSQAQWSSAAGRSAAAAWRACVLQTLLGYLVAMGWIAFAAVQLRRIETVDQQQLMIVTIAGATVVLIAVVHRLMISRRAILSLAAAETESTTENGTEDDRGFEIESDNAADSDPPTEPELDTELIDVQPLRR